ncbi:type I 3-dehydroquinate dehydratase [Haloferula sp.]|uniref:type I 3-dehydroquinate dehydratase n=1 Tax=Haloferula sp. TaxID=2497595 RepID=UPI003C74CE9D
MPRIPIDLQAGVPLIVGSFGDLESLNSIPIHEIRESCDLVEIRLDLLPWEPMDLEQAPWLRLMELPLLFTARRGSEGGAGNLDAMARMTRLRSVIEVASLIDIEVASITEMQSLIEELAAKDLPWIGSFHNFAEASCPDVLSAQRMLARNAGASGFKAAVELGWNMDLLAPLSLFLQQAKDYPVSLMGMGPLAPVSRVLFAQLGSVLNYGYLGHTPTAPGQWSARQLKEAISATVKA